jgi:hypothetical protein
MEKCKLGSRLSSISQPQAYRRPDERSELVETPPTKLRTAVTFPPSTFVKSVGCPRPGSRISSACLLIAWPNAKRPTRTHSAGSPHVCNQLQRWTRTSSVRAYIKSYVRCTSLYVPYARTQAKSTSGTTVPTSIATPVRLYHVQFLHAPSLIGSRLHEVDT